MLRRLTAFSCFCLLGIGAGKAIAAPVTSAFFYNQINNADDRDGDTLIKGPGNTAPTIEKGDYLLAVLKVDTIDGQLGGSTSVNDASTFDELTGVSLIKVATEADNGTVGGVQMSDFTFSAPSAAEWTTITTALGVPLTPLAPAGHSAFADSTMLMVFDSPQDFTRNSTLMAGLSTASNGTLLWQGGFTGAAGEGWMAHAPANLAALAAGTPLGNQVRLSSNVTFGVDVTYTGPGATGIALLPTTQIDGLTTAFGAPTQFQGTGGFDTPASGSSWAVWSHTNIYIDPVAPEPSSFVLFGIGLTGAWVARRKRRSVVQA